MLKTAQHAWTRMRTIIRPFFHYHARWRALTLFVVLITLVLSLNATSVRLLARVGLDDFVQLLRSGGLTTLDRRPDAYGLPLILGGGEVTLLDLTNLYATLAEGGVQPRWSPEGDELFYLDPAGRLMAVAIPGGDPRRAAAPRALFETPLRVSNTFDQFAVASKERFLFRLPFGDDPQVPVNVIVGWDR